MFAVPITVDYAVAAWLQYGRIEEMNVCDNLGDHLVGNVYIKVGGSFSHKKNTSNS